MRSLLYQTLELLFRLPIVILMLGDWRTGKTDTSLLVGHVSKKWDLIDKIGANIWTYNDPQVEHITNLGKLKRWLHADKQRKLFIFDEALAHIPRRSAMSHKNVSFLKLLAEISKGHARLILCTQISKIDSDVLDPAFTRAIWKKKGKKVMECISKHHAPRTFTGLPKSPIRFDPDRLAPFTLEEGVVYGESSVTLKVANLYANGWSFRNIAKELGLHDETVRREIKKVLKAYLKREQIKVIDGPKIPTT